MKINDNYNLRIKLYSSSHCDVIPVNDLQKVSNPEIIRTTKKLDAYGGNSLKVIGKYFLECKFVNREKIKREFTVVECEKKLLTWIGLPTLTELNLIKRVHNIENTEINKDELLKAYENVFNGKTCILN